MTQGCTSIEARLNREADGIQEEGGRLCFLRQDIDMERDEAEQSRQFPFKMQKGNFFVII